MAAACASAGLFSAPRAAAEVFQSDAVQTPLPQPVGTAELDLITSSWAYSASTQVWTDPDGNSVVNDMLLFGDFYPTFEDGDAITLAGLFKWRGEDIDPVADARIAPGHFTAECGFTAEIVLRGGTCASAFGWYNIEDPLSATPPALAQIHTAVPDTISDDLSCQAPIGDGNGFCPLAWDSVNPRYLDQPAWTPRTFSTPLSDDANYLGGYIGFALLPDADLYCTATKYSHPEHNQRNASDQPWVTTVIYASTVDPNGYYIAFEDLPMSADDWTQTGIVGNNGSNDGDFNDFVYFVSGDGCRLCAGDCPPDTSGSAGSGGGSGASSSAGDGGSAANGATSAGEGSGGSSSSGDTGAASTGTGGLPATMGTSASGESSGSGGDGSGGTLGAAGEGSGPDRTGPCAPGRQLRCACPGGADGVQVCNDDGDGYEPCQCGASSGDSGGCGCRLAQHRRPGFALGLALLAAGTLSRRVRRRKKRRNRGVNVSSH